MKDFFEDLKVKQEESVEIAESLFDELIKLKFILKIFRFKI